MPQRVATTDGRYVKVDEDKWWDTTGIDTVPEQVVNEYMKANPRVGVIVRELAEEDMLGPTRH
jgi:hypothetical protein